MTPLRTAARPRGVDVVAGLLLLGVLVVLAPPSLAAAQHGTTQEADASGAALLAAALDTGRQVPHDARMVVATIGADGQPSLRHHLVRSRPGDVQALAHLDVDRLVATHRVRGSGRVSLNTGAARVVGIGHPGATDRERLFVDERTGLLVRREVFDAEGKPVRVVAYTELTVVGHGQAADRDERVTLREDRALADDRLDILDATGWYVPHELVGFRLVDGYAANQGPDGSVLHLRYDDGLYELSVYEQVGPLDRDALVDAVAIDVAGGTAWHWPGASPPRLVLSGDGLTFTVVSEAPMDVVVPALAALPNDQRPGVARRMSHGARRVAGWVWPFD